jgi:hypothetical protein
LIVPNKVISFNETILSKLPSILKVINNNRVDVKTLYKKTENLYECTNDFLLSMDTLFILNKIELIDGDIKIC